MLLAIGDEGYEGGAPADWNNFALNSNVLRGGSTAANQWIFPGTGHHEWGDSGSTPMTGATVHSPADGLKPYMDSKASGLAYGGPNLWYYFHDIASVGWRIVHLSGTTQPPNVLNPIHNTGDPLVPLGGSVVSNKALTSNVATLTVVSGHGINVGNSVTVALSPADANFDGTFTVTAVGGTTISYAKTHANIASAATGGEVGTAQWSWFRDRLVEAVTNDYCVLACWSDPLFATTDDHHSAEPAVLPLFTLLQRYRPNQALILNSHKHNYERMSKMLPNGTVSTLQGVPNIVIGTGGNGHYLFTGATATGSNYQDDTNSGVLTIALSDKRAVTTFIAVGATPLDGPITFSLNGGGVSPPPPPPPPATGWPPTFVGATAYGESNTR